MSSLSTYVTTAYHACAREVCALYGPAALPITHDVIARVRATALEHQEATRPAVLDLCRQSAFRMADV